MPSSFRLFYTNPQVNTVATRHGNNNNLYLPRPRTNFSKNSIYYMVPSTWNNLPNDLKFETNRNRFKNNIKLNALNKYSEFVNCNDLFCPQCAR